jgi:Putative prokaryotic signal transducing protein
MAYCPQCGTEYREGSPECIDCHVALRPGPLPAAVREPEQALPRDVKLIPVHIFSGGTALMEAHLAKSWLESEGIPCVLPGETSVGMLPVLDVPLLVRQEDADEATRILKEYLESNAAEQNDEPA